MPLLQQLEYELGEFKAPGSLLTSFTAYLRRQKDLGYHRELNLNLVRYRFLRPENC